MNTLTARPIVILLGTLLAAALTLAPATPAHADGTTTATASSSTASAKDLYAQRLSYWLALGLPSAMAAKSAGQDVVHLTPYVGAAKIQAWLEALGVGPSAAYSIAVAWADTLAEDAAAENPHQYSESIASARAEKQLPVTVSGGSAAQRRRILALAKQAGVPAGTRIQIKAVGHWGKTYPGRVVRTVQYDGYVLTYSRSLIRISPRVARRGGAVLKYDVTHESMHARQYEAGGSWSRMLRNAGGSVRAIECQADRMTRLAGVPLPHGSYLSRGYGRYCTTKAAKAALAASR